MLPVHHSQQRVFSILSSWLYKVREWIRHEIVDDDPWDKDTLFPDAQELAEQPLDSDSPELEQPESAQPESTQADAAEPPVEN
jgi:hypothetical protein